jgi:glutathione S-transferase
MLIYYDWNASPNCFKTKVLLLELGIPYEQRDVSRADLQGPAFRADFPAGLSPALEDGELRLSESAAIALHLAETYAPVHGSSGARGRLLPSEPTRRALMHQALFIEASMLAPVVGGRGYFGELFKPEAQRDEARLHRLAEEAQRVAEVLSQLLGSRDYFADEFSIADIQLYAACAKAIEHGLFRQPSPGLLAWYRRVGARPSVIAAREQYLPYRSGTAERSPADKSPAHSVQVSAAE